jgi:hypothetical protein
MHFTDAINGYDVLISLGGYPGTTWPGPDHVVHNNNVTK